VITVDLANTIFLGCLAVGGILLLVSVLLGDVLGGIFDSLNIDLDLGGVSLLPVLLGFVAMFGVGGLFGTEGLDLEAGPASLVGAIAGAIGAGTVIVLFRALRSAEAPGATATSSLVGRVAQVTVTVEPGGYGTVIVDFDGAPVQRRATAEQTIPAGRRVRIVSIIGSDVFIEPIGTADPGKAVEAGEA
jgi:membrane protein implicated in regulation of membrane protease activity